jgi:hypothetical protein
MCLSAVCKQAASRPTATHAARRPSSAISVDVTTPDTRRRHMMLQPAMRTSAGAQPALHVTDAPPSRPTARPAQAFSTTSTCTIRPPGPGRTSPPPSAAPSPRQGTVTASRRRGASSTCTGVLMLAVREGWGERRAWGWWGPRRGGASCCHETGGGHGAGWQARRRASG